MGKKIALLDIDGTAKIARNLAAGRVYGVHKIILEDLNRKNIKDLYFFSNMDLSDISQNNVFSVPGLYPSITRWRLVQFFESNGFIVHGVITPADVIYKKGLGAAYRDFYVPAYKEYSADPSAYAGNRRDAESHESKYNRISAALVELHGDSIDHKQKASLNKARMYEYFKELVDGKEFTEIEYYEDDETCIDAIQKIDQSITCHHIIDQKTAPLYVIGSEAFDTMISQLVGSENKNNEFYCAKLTDQALKLVTLRELEQTMELCDLSPQFKEKLNLAIVERGDQVDTFEADIQRFIADDVRKARSRLFTVIAGVVNTINLELYQEITAKPKEANKKGFSIGCCEKTIYEYYPKLIPMLMGDNAGYFKDYLRVKTSEVMVLHQKASDLLAPLKDYGFDEYAVSVEELLRELRDALEQKRMFGLFTFKDEPEKYSEYGELHNRLFPILGQLSKIMDDQSLIRRHGENVQALEHESEAVLLKKFMKKQLERVNQDQSKIGGVFAHTNVASLTDLTSILAEATSKKSTRKKQICIELEWLNKDGDTLHDSAPSAVREAYERARRLDSDSGLSQRIKK